MSSPVCALTITDRSSRVLVAVRDRSSNVTHPDTISVPTQRIPAALLHAIVRREPGPGGHDPCVYAAEAVMARKLGVADALERDEIDYGVALAGVEAGEAHYANLPPGDQSEAITMANLVVDVRTGAELFATSTASYRAIVWTDVGDFLAACATRDPLRVVPGADPFELCIQGMCITAAERELRRRYGAAAPVATP